MNLELMKKIVDGAPAMANFYIPGKACYTRMGSVLLDGATDYLIYDGSLYYFQKRGVRMHQWIRTRFNPIPFSCSAFYKFKPL